MKENILFEGKFSKCNWLAITFIILGFLIFFIGLIGWGDFNAIIEFASQGCAEIFFIIGPMGCFLIALIIFLMMKNCQFIITDKRIYGRATFGNRVSLPLDKVSAVSISFLKSLVVSTSSRKLTFWLISNGDEAWQIMNALIVEKQK